MMFKAKKEKVARVLEKNKEGLAEAKNRAIPAANPVIHLSKIGMRRLGTVTNRLMSAHIVLQGKKYLRKSMFQYTIEL